MAVLLQSCSATESVVCVTEIPYSFQALQTIGAASSWYCCKNAAVLQVSLDPSQADDADTRVVNAQFTAFYSDADQLPSRGCIGTNVTNTAKFSADFALSLAQLRTQPPVGATQYDRG
jgi:hypothetical protein